MLIYVGINFISLIPLIRPPFVPISVVILSCYRAIQKVCRAKDFTPFCSRETLGLRCMYVLQVNKWQICARVISRHVQLLWSTLCMVNVIWAQWYKRISFTARLTRQRVSYPAYAWINNLFHIYTTTTLHLWYALWLMSGGWWTKAYPPNNKLTHKEKSKRWVILDISYENQECKRKIREMDITNDLSRDIFISRISRKLTVSS